jgi:hypothetical protein
MARTVSIEFVNDCQYPMVESRFDSDRDPDFDWPTRQYALLLFPAAFFILFTAPARAGIVAPGFFFRDGGFNRVQQNFQIGEILGFVGRQVDLAVPATGFALGRHLFAFLFRLHRNLHRVLFGAQSRLLFAVKYFFHLSYLCFGLDLIVVCHPIAHGYGAGKNREENPSFHHLRLLNAPEPRVQVKPY